MTHAEQEEILRRALHAVADTIEPAADGLERIRERLSRPRPLAQPLLMGMEPVLADAADRMSERLGTWLRPAIEPLRPAIGGLLAAIWLLRPRSGMSRHEKLRSALAFAAAALIGTVGGLALSGGLPEHVIQEAGSIFSPGQAPSTHGGGNNLGPGGPGQHGFPSAAGPGTYTRHRPSPSTTSPWLRRLRPTPPPGHRWPAGHRRSPRHRRLPRHRRPDQHSHGHGDPAPGVSPSPSTSHV
jgi:hypothetical protein